ncbi:porphobilinogen synthase [Corynebacterium sp. 320]|uniref:Delta-aminolevulinic acid dehydratase n=1 Tax=Corynebacterium zhongnanshanii TaxID=2768834 RepID=A0ABQ6VE60_9CORY|nr:MULTISPECIES: porphobilinogen synthase [Corynebacterium]KAB1504416.1 porphobilinogen synthase [Corynebacterium sp. 320]KAB1552485.1 porphobilinogen synthase [Corynebacterium sp. 321]KAB1554300.1 porphobilinogen synthase [Corynebacterium sp. 319]KAB3522727.1 porphobilinogen synthase [Corynebacterium zhongnanshanii]KAB3528552.1 porphobilinogen synthase [Corynebacterium sp. 250]
MSNYQKLVSEHTPLRRPRRLRTSPVMRNFVAETDINPNRLVLPMFIAEGIDAPRDISSLPGVQQHTFDSLLHAVEEAAEAGVGAVDLFGVPTDENKDATGSAGCASDGILNRGVEAVRERFGDDILVMADTCLDEFTDHGHCGLLQENARGTVVVDNDATLQQYAAMAVSQARAGAHIVSPSGMMDGQIRVIREALDQAGFQDVSIMAYSAKYASAFYGPFREAVGSSLQGDRRTYQQDARNLRESLLEVQLDIDEGADMVMVKPAMPYLDVLREVANESPVPVAAYQVSGEYAMISAAAQNGWIDREPAIIESLYGIRRAGADIILTYWATEAARLLA